MSDNPAMEMLGALMLAAKIPTRTILRAHGGGLLLAEYTLTEETFTRLPQITGMQVTAHWDPARFMQVYRAELEYMTRPPLEPVRYMIEGELHD
jgi:hypothetical protein